MRMLISSDETILLRMHTKDATHTPHTLTHAECPPVAVAALSGPLQLDFSRAERVPCKITHSSASCASPSDFSSSIYTLPNP